MQTFAVFDWRLARMAFIFATARPWVLLATVTSSDWFRAPDWGYRNAAPFTPSVPEDVNWAHRRIASTNQLPVSMGTK